MGNTGSTGGGGQGGGGKPTAVKKCYYELLSVERTATQEEIKKAYKRKALELHPDRNFGNADIATLLFAEVQAAYEVLSDPQERAWYDSHRDVILHGKDPSSANAAGSGSSPYTSTTTSAEVLSWFGLFPSKSEIDYSDSPNGFYAMLDSAFARLAREEAQACEEQGLEELYYPSFGGLKSGYEDHVKGFYAHWTKFKTYKDFAWCDLYRLSGAPERRIRRAMEKENQRLRDDAKRDFEDNVRQFVQFVRKRDPRYTPKTGPTEAERQAANLARSKEQAAKARAANAARQAEYKAADWTEVNHDEAYPIDEYIDGIRPDEECEALVYECPACKKKFKTEGQFVAHEKSKKHKQAVWQRYR
ncbi:hypothetical protein BDZ91DRAFT_387175 [Kalaharituber pfeilii]|nr:hypothetical protein BDZ91DRAFT_387175 [Kalaharituber pfeilii]